MTGGSLRGDSDRLVMADILVWLVASQTSFIDNSLNCKLTYCTFCVSTKRLTKMRFWVVK